VAEETRFFHEINSGETVARLNASTANPDPVGTWGRPPSRCHLRALEIAALRSSVGRTEQLPNQALRACVDLEGRNLAVFVNDEVNLHVSAEVFVSCRLGQPWQ
jgi:hypothetical protein